MSSSQNSQSKLSDGVQNSNIKNGVNSKNQVNDHYQDDEVRINPDLEKFFKRREYMDQISRPMIRQNKKRFGDGQSGDNERGAQQSVSNQRRALEQINIIHKQDQNNEALQMSKLKRYEDRLSTALKGLQSWEEPLIIMGVGKTFDEKFEMAERMLNNWQDLGLVDGPETEQMMLKYPEYEEQIQEEKSQIIQQQQTQMPSKKLESRFNYNGSQVDQDINNNNNDFQIRKIRGGSSTARNQIGSQEQTRSVQQSPRRIAQKPIQQEQQRSQYLNDSMQTPQNKYRISYNSNPKQNQQMIDEQMMKNINESKLLEEKKTHMLNNNLNSLKQKYLQKQLSNTQPIQNSTTQIEYNQPILVNNFNYQDDIPRHRTPRRIDKISTPQEYQEPISNGNEKQFKLRYSSGDPNKNNVQNGFSNTSSAIKYGNLLNNNNTQKKDNQGIYYLNYEDNDTSSHFPQIRKYQDTFSTFSGGKSKNSLNQTRPETPSRKINYGSTAYPHSQQLYSQPRGNTPKYQRIQQS